ncbi:23416_t:CDS:1, partial [Racocetra persica]
FKEVQGQSQAMDLIINLFLNENAYALVIEQSDILTINANIQ